MPTARRAAALLALTALAFLLPLPHFTGDGVPEYDIRLSSIGAAFAADTDDGFWVTEPMEVEATTVGLSWNAGAAPDGQAFVRSSDDGQDWSEWVPLSVDDVHGPDPDTDEAKAARSASSPVFIGDDDMVQFRVEAEHAPDMNVELVDTQPKRGGLIERIPLPSLPQADAAPPRPNIVTRSQWGASQCQPRSSPSIASNADVMFVHHTVNPNTYTEAQARQMVLNICLYHRNSQGWSDIGYNFLVDRFGTIYEGRAGGIERAVVGAHTGGYNSRSIGVSFLGTHTTAAPTSAARNSFVAIAAWKMDLHKINPHGRSTLNSRTFNNLSGHRDAGSTSCPGDACYRLLGTFRNEIQSRLYGFTDLAGSAHAADIAKLAERGVTQGCNPPANTRFCPKDPVTREQMAGFLVRALGLTRTSSAGTFSDVPSDSTFATDINRLATAGITSGCNPPANTRFCPKDRVTREQMAAFLVRARGYSASSSAGIFVDVPVGHKFRTDINRLATADVTRGCNPPTNDRYCPSSHVTREQMASFIVRAMKW